MKNENTKAQNSRASEDNQLLVHYYSEAEEKLNILTHGLGFGFSILGTYFLILKALHFADRLHFMSFVIYGLSLVCLYAASTFYHSAKDPKRRRLLNIIDHAAIYLLIAGSYTPFTIITLKGFVGETLFIAVWVFAFVGIFLKLFYTGKYSKLSTAMYVLMGWLAIFAINPLIENLHPSGLKLVIGGGILYTLGALFYSIDSIKFNHAIFHVFVMGGSLGHYLAIYLFV